MTEVWFKDIDPDTGDERHSKIADCETKELADWVRHAVEKEWYSDDGPQDPCREFYVKGT